MNNVKNYEVIHQYYKEDDLFPFQLFGEYVMHCSFMNFKRISLGSQTNFISLLLAQEILR